MPQGSLGGRSDPGTREVGVDGLPTHPVWKTPGNGPVYCVLSPRLGRETPNTGARANHRSLNGRFPMVPFWAANDPPWTFRNVPPFNLVFFPPNTMTGMFF